MKKNPFVVISLVVVVLLFSGCTGTSPLTNISNDEIGEEVIIIPITAVSYDEPEVEHSYCGHSPEDDCHSITVEVYNNKNEDFSTNGFNWDAWDEQQNSYFATDVDGPDNILAGGNATLRLHFHVPIDVKLIKLSWEDFFQSKVEVVLPDYEHITRFNVTLEVIDTQIVDENDECSSDKDLCHMINISISNYGEIDFINERAYWGGIANNGGFYEWPDIDGPSLIIPGGELNITLYFELEEGIKLTELRWEEYDFKTSVTVRAY
jgi:hypothetical protein